MKNKLSNEIITPPVPVVAKAMRVIAEVACGSGQPESLQALAKRLGIAQATCYRIVRTLEQAGWLTGDARTGLHLGPGLRALSGAVGLRKRLVQIADPVLRDLAKAIRLSCKVTLRMGDEAVTIARADSDAPYRITSAVGTRFTLCTGSSGALLLRDAAEEELERLIRLAPKRVWKYQTPDDLRKRIAGIHRNGFALDRGKYHPDVHGLSVAIELPGDQLAALTVIAMPSGMPNAKVPHLYKQARCAAAEIQEAINEGEAS